MAMSADSSDPQQRGLDFETFLYKVFALFDLEHGSSSRCSTSRSTAR
jgi:hypothetical protein